MSETYTSPELTRLRGPFPRVRMYCAFHVPQTLCAFQLAEAPAASAPVSALVYDPETVTGTIPEWVDLTLYVGSTPGAWDKGYTRVRGWDTDNNRVLVGPVGEGDIRTQWEAGDYLTVVKQILLWPRVPSSSGQDYGLFPQSNQETALFRPIINLGPPAVGRVGQPISFVAEFSDDMEQTGGITSWHWLFPDGQEFTSMGTTVSPVVWTPDEAFPTGDYVIVTATIGATGKSSERWGQLWVYAADAALPTGMVDPIAYSDTGATTTLHLYDDSARHLTEANYPPRTAVCVWSDTRWPDDTTTEIGSNYPYREHLWFHGWTLGETINTTALGTPSLDVQVGTHDAALALLKSTAFSLYGGSAASIVASNYQFWVSFGPLTVKTAIRHMARWFTTIDRVADLRFTGSYEETTMIGRLDMQVASAWAQLTNIAGRVPVVSATCDATGALWIGPRPWHLQAADRSAYAEVLHITNADRAEVLSVQRQVYPRLSQVAMSGSAYAGGAVVGATRMVTKSVVSPRYIMGYHGEREQKTAHWFPYSPTTIAAAWAGCYRGAENVEYPSLTIRLPGMYRINPVPYRRVALTLTAAHAGQRLSWAGATFWVKRATFTYDPALATIVTDLELRQDGPELAGYDVPVSVRPGRPRPPSPPKKPIPPPPPPQLDYWCRNVWLITRNSGAYYTEDFTGPGGAVPQWALITGGDTLPATHKVWQVREDPATIGAAYCLIQDTASPQNNESWAVWRLANNSWSRLVSAGDLAALVVAYWDGQLGDDNDGGANIWDNPLNIRISSIAVSRANTGYVAAVLAGNVHNKHEGGSGTYAAYHMYSLDSGATWALGVRLEDPNPTVTPIPPGHNRDWWTYYSSDVSKDGSLVLHPMTESNGNTPNFYVIEGLTTAWSDPTPAPSVFTPPSEPDATIVDLFFRCNPYDGKWVAFKRGALLGTSGTSPRTGWATIHSYNTPLVATAHEHAMFPYPAVNGVSLWWYIENGGGDLHILKSLGGDAYTINSLELGAVEYIHAIVPGATRKNYIVRTTTNSNPASQSIYAAEIQTGLDEMTAYPKSGSGGTAIPGNHGGIAGILIDYTSEAA